jgi:hypothetical protein
MADTDDDARRGPDGRRRRPPPTIEGQAVEIPIANEAPPVGESPAEAPAAAMTEHEATVTESAAPAEQVTEPAMAQAAAETTAAESIAAESVAAETEASAAKPVTSVPGVSATLAPDAAPNPESAPRSAPPPKARTPWFAVFAAGILGAGLTALAAGAAWIYGAPLIEPDTSSLNARLTRLEMHTPTAAEIAAATVPDMGKVSAAKIDELAARLTKLEAAEATAARQPAAAADGAKLDELTARVSRLETAPPAASPAASSPAVDPAELKELAARITALDTAVKPIAQHLTDIERQGTANAKAAQDAGARADTVAKAMADVQRVDADQEKRQQGTRTEVAAVAERLAAVETQVKQVGDQLAEAAVPKPDEALRYALIAAGLRSALERGDPFTAELAAARTAGLDPAVLTQIAPFASTGIPNVQDLFRELGALIPEMLKVSAPASHEGTYLDRLQAHAERLVRIRPVGDQAGDDPATVIGRIERDMARRDLAAVLAEFDKLPAPAQAVAEAWRKKALARQTAGAASAKLVAASFAKLGASAGATKQ